MRPHQFRQSVLGKPVIDHGEDPLGKFAIVFQDPFITVYFEKHQCGNCAGSLVALFESVVLDDAIEKGGREAKHILLVRKFPTIARARHGAFQQRGMAQTVRFIRP